MAEYRVLHEKLGVSTHGNPLTLNPSTLRVGKNFECVRDGIYRKPRGRDSYGSGIPNQTIKQFLEYKNRLFIHLDNNSLYYDSNGTGTFSLKSSSISDPESGYKIKFVEQNGNLYITTFDGVKKLDSLTGSLTSAGMPQGEDFDLRLVTGTWFDNNKIVAYRCLYSTYDINGNKMFGAPSERQDIENTSGGTKQVSLRVSLPDDVTTSHYLEIYRTSIVASGSIPPEDFQLVYQAKPTSAEIAQGYMVVTDASPEGFRGLELYTNPTQEGIENANTRPPKASSITKYKTFTFFANTESIQRLYFNLINSDDLLAGTSTLTISNGTSTLTLGCAADVVDSTVSLVADAAGLAEIQTTAAHGLATGDYVRFLDVTGAGGFPELVNEKIFEITKTANDKFTFGEAWSAGYTATAGTVDFYEDVGSTPRFIISNTGSVGVDVDLTARSIIRTINLCTGNPGWIGYYISGYDDVVGKMLITSQNIGDSEFYLNVGRVEDKALYTSPIPFSSSVSGTSSSGGLIKITTSLAHGLSTGDNVLISDVTGTTEANGTWSVVVVDATSFTLTGSTYVHAWISGGLVRPKDYKSVNDNFANAVMWSKPGEPEHVPLINIQKVGSADDPILAVVGLKDSLFIIKKKDGIFRLTGETASSFVIDEFDGTVECLQKNSIAKGQNAIFMMSSLGFVKISDIGVEVVGRDNEFKDLIASASTNFETDGYGWFYEEEKSYFIATHTNLSSTSNDRVLVYNTFTNAWTQREHGVYTNDRYINLGRVINGYLYTAATSGPYVYKERKSFSTTDFASPSISVNITSIDSATNQIVVSSNLVIPDGSLITQGAATARILDTINSATYEVNTVANLVVGAITITPGIVSTLKYQSLHCGMPEYEKQGSKIVLFFDNDETDVGDLILRTATDLDRISIDTHLFDSTTLWGKFKWGLGQWGTPSSTDRMATYLPEEHTRFTYLDLEVVHERPREQLALCGFSVLVDPVDTRLDT
jgi:hypothetical protein